uniref:Conserved oligomeric Golgi complex subunit 8 n=2 Tax=Emiliania huxleyi TaxID=2903 RepID=A0A0D3ILT2_EMIH1
MIVGPDLPSEPSLAAAPASCSPSVTQRLSQAPAAPAESLLSQVRSALSLDDQVCTDLLDGTEDLESLQGLSLDAVRRRPAQLRAMQVGLEAQLLGLASGPGTSGFVEAAECAAEVRERTAAMLDAAVALGAALPAVGRASSALFRDAREGSGARAKLGVLSDCHDDLVELLEQPQLAASAVRNG